MTLPFKPEHVIDGSIESKDITAVELEPGLLSIDVYYLSSLTGEWTSDPERGIQFDTDTVRRLLPIARTFLAAEEARTSADAYFWVNVRCHDGTSYRSIGQRSHATSDDTAWFIVGHDEFVGDDHVTVISKIETPP